MKKLKWFLAVCLIAIISTGCVKFNAKMDIKKDKSMDFSIIYAFDKSMMSMMGDSGGLKEEDFDEVKKQGYTVEKYTQDNYEGFKITKKIKNIDEVSTDQDTIFNLSGMMEEKEDNKYMFKVVKGEDKNTYYAKFKFDSNDSGMNDNTNEGGQALPDENETLTNEVLDSSDTLDANETLDDSNDIDLSGLTGSMDLSFSVNLPYSAISSNATTKENDGKNLSWKLTSTGKQSIEFAFELKNNESECNNLLLYIGIGAGVLLLIAIIVIIIVSSKNFNL